MPNPPRRLQFFATGHDLKPAMLEVESKLPVRYIEMGLFPAEGPPQAHRSCAELSDLGKMAAGDQNQGRSYLVLGSNTVLQFRDVRLKDGSTRIAVDQAVNSDSIVMRPGGVFGETLIAGGVDTISNSTNSLELFSLIRRAMETRFTKIRSYLVGVEAERMLDAGHRLTHNIRASSIYDLKRV